MKLIDTRNLPKEVTAFIPGHIYKSNQTAFYYLCARVSGYSSAEKVQLINTIDGCLVEDPLLSKYTHEPNAGLYIPGIS